MFSKLIVTFEDEQIVFELHELVKVAISVMRARIANLQAVQAVQARAEAMAAKYSEQVESDILEMDTEDTVVDIPLYQDYSRILLEKVEKAIDEVATRYEDRFDIYHNFRMETSQGEQLINPLAFLLKLLYKTDMSYFLVSGGWQAWSELLNFLKQQDKPPLLNENYSLDLLLPPNISQINTASKWLYVARYLKSQCRSEPVKAWWLNIAGRLILLENLPREKEHFYVSDHGTAEESLQRANNHMISFTETGRTDLLHAVSFMKFYNEKLSGEEQELLKKHFLFLRKNGFGGNDNANVVLLQCLGLPKSARLRAIKTGNIESVGFGSIGMKNRVSDPWVDEITDQQIANINEREYAQFEREYINALEANRYLGEVLARPFIEGQFTNGMGPLFTQFDNAFHPNDSTQLKRLITLHKVAEKAGQGLREFLFRPANAFASRDKGESYRGFAAAFKHYFSQDACHTASEIAQVMRNILLGKISEDPRLYFLPNLVAAWFISEAARNEMSILSGLILLDLIEASIELKDEDDNNLYSWHHVLIHPKKPAHTLDKVLIRDLYGDEIDLGFFDGMHPMAHRDSVQHARSELGEKQKLSAVRQKEGHLLIHWLFEKLKKVHPNLCCSVVLAKPSSESSEALPCRLLDTKLTSYKLIDKLLQASGKPSGSIKKQPSELKKWKVLHEILIPLLTERASSFDLLLQSNVSLEVNTSHKISFSTVTPLQADDVLDAVLRESRSLAENQKKIGPRFIPGWVLKDVEDKGNCFYDAISHQMQLIEHPFFLEIPDGTLPRDVLRLRVQKEEFKDEEWAEDKTIDEFVSTFDVVLGVVNTALSEIGFTYYYKNIKDGTVITVFPRDEIELPNGFPIIRLATTGNHFLSVVRTADEVIKKMITSSLSRSAVSFFTRVHEIFITENRNENPQLRRAFDERFGIVLRT